MTAAAPVVGQVPKPDEQPLDTQASMRRFRELLELLAQEHEAALQRAGDKACARQQEEVARSLCQAAKLGPASGCDREPPKAPADPFHRLASPIDFVRRISRSARQVSCERRASVVDMYNEAAAATPFMSDAERSSVRAGIATVLQDYPAAVSKKGLSHAALDAETARSQKLDRSSSKKLSRQASKLGSTNSAHDLAPDAIVEGEATPSDAGTEPEPRWPRFQSFLAAVRKPISPSSFFMEVWRPMLFIAVAVAVTMAPFEIVFHWWEPPGAYKLFARSLDIFFIVDMAINFNLAYLHDGHIVSDRKSIAKHYLQTYFFFDLISNTPYDWLMGSSEGKSRKIAKMLKVPKLLRMVKLLRTLKDLTQYVGVPLNFAALHLATHYWACLWVAIELTNCDPFTTCPPVADTYLESFTMSFSALIGADARRRIEDPLETSHLMKLRDPSEPPVGAVEDLLLSLMAGSGVALVACLFANTAAALTAASAAARRRTEMLAQRMFEMRAAHFPKSLRQRVKQTYEYMAQAGKTDRIGMLEDPTLSIDLRRNLAFHMYANSLRKVPFLAAIPERYLKCLAQKVQTRTYTPGDLLIMSGEVSQELFILQTGSVRSVGEDFAPLRDTVLGPGCFFGELCFLELGSKRTASIQCVQFCSALVLTIEAFMELGLGGLLNEIRTEAQMLLDSGEHP